MKVGVIANSMYNVTALKMNVVHPKRRLNVRTSYTATNL